MPAGARVSRTWRQVCRSLPFVIGLAFLATVSVDSTMSTGHGSVVRQPGVAAQEWASTELTDLTALTDFTALTGTDASASVSASAWATTGPAKFAGAANWTASGELAVQTTGPADGVPLTPQSVPDGVATPCGAQPPAVPGGRAPPTRV